MARRTYTITGHVQGVGFRWWTRKLAHDMDLQGTVRNASDGSVEVRVAGEPAALNRFAVQLREGPPTASVREVLCEEPDGEALPAGFEIVR